MLNRLNGLKRLGFFALSICVFFSATSRVRCQTNTAKPRWVSNRYLLIVETSHSTHHRFDGVIKTVGNLLVSSIGGQIRQGDSLGVWTYNQQLYTGRLPLQRWATLEKEDIASTVLNFLKSQKYEKQPAFASVRPALNKVIKDSEFITIILVSSGEDAMTGTPFDDQINELYKNWRAEQEKTRMPLVTVLRAKRGAITGFSVTPPPWQIEIPAWPAEPSVAKAAIPETAAPKAQPPTVPPLIVTGKKSKPEITNSAETPGSTIRAALPGPQNQEIKPGNPPAERTAVQSASATPQKATTNPPAERTAVVERKIEKTEVPQRSPEPTSPPLKEMAASSATPKPEKAAVVNNGTNAPVPAQTPQKPAPPPQEISTDVATPAPGLLSSKAIWTVGAAALASACVVLIVLARRPRSGHISLITRSLEREK